MKVEFFRHNINSTDINRVNGILTSLFLTTGKEVKIFEENLSGFIGTKKAVGLNSCTAALHLALEACGIGKGDEVITTPLSYVATAHAVMNAGAIPKFVDVEQSTGNMNVDNIEKVISRKTRAIIPVHLYGQMVDMKRLSLIAKKYKLTVIEDAAHALEASRDGVRPGQLSAAACFSFYATKSITSGEGGAVVTNKSNVARLVRQLRQHGVSIDTVSRHGGLYRHYDVTLLGWKYNMNNIQAAMLIGQLKRVRKNWLRRVCIAGKYEKEFSKAGIDIPKSVSKVRHARHLFTIWVNPKRRDSIVNKLRKRGIGAVVNYKPIHLMSYYKRCFKYRAGDFPNAERIGARTISIPLYAGLSNVEVDYVIQHVKDVCR